MMSRLLRSLGLLPIVLLSGCTTEPNPAGPSVPPRGSVPVTAPSNVPLPQPKSIAEYRRAKLEKEQAEADAAAQKAAPAPPKAAAPTP
jgi:hypothetical protein